MNPNALTRVTALLLSALVGISTAGVAVAHGHTHLEMHEHAGAGVAASHAPDRDHDHPEVTLRASVRSDAPLVLAVPTRPAATVATEMWIGSGLPDVSRRIHHGSSRVSPRQPRAPPLA